MDYLTELGIEGDILQSTVRFSVNHKYDIQDYDYIDPHYGKIVGDEGTQPGDRNNSMPAALYHPRDG